MAGKDGGVVFESLEMRAKDGIMKLAIVKTEEEAASRILLQLNLNSALVASMTVLCRVGGK